MKSAKARCSTTKPHNPKTFLACFLRYDFGDWTKKLWNRLYFSWGTGANGKSTLLIVIQQMLADYAQQAANEVLTIKLADIYISARFLFAL